MLGTARLTGQSIGAVIAAIAFSATHSAPGRGPVVALAIAATFAAAAGVFSLLRVRMPAAGR